MSPVWLILLLLQGFTYDVCGDNITQLVVTCQSHSDLDQLVYSICVEYYVCAFLYGIEEGHHHKHAQFWHQMRVFDLFGRFGNHSFTYGRWPTNVTVLYDTNATSCYNLTNLTSEEQALFNAVALERLLTHKEYFSALVCPHRNERLLFDNDTGQFHCHCPADRDCSGSSTHDSTKMILYGLTLGFFALILLVVFFFGVRIATK